MFTRCFVDLSEAVLAACEVLYAVASRLVVLVCAGMTSRFDPSLLQELYQLE